MNLCDSFHLTTKINSFTGIKAEQEVKYHWLLIITWQSSKTKWQELATFQKENNKSGTLEAVFLIGFLFHGYFFESGFIFKTDLLISCCTFISDWVFLLFILATVENNDSPKYDTSNGIRCSQAPHLKPHIHFVLWSKIQGAAAPGMLFSKKYQSRHQLIATPQSQGVCRLPLWHQRHSSS